MVRKSIASSTHKHDALAAFLKAHVGAAFSDDVGPLFGQAAVIVEGRVPGGGTKSDWIEAVNAALTAEAHRDVLRSEHGPARIRAPRGHRKR